jgi:membrane protease YdiL (CAAX protease family)
MSQRFAIAAAFTNPHAAKKKRAAVTRQMSKRNRERARQSKQIGRAPVSQAGSISGEDAGFWNIFQTGLAKADVWPFVAICITACFSLGFVQFAGSDQTFIRFFPPQPNAFDTYWPLRYKAWWVGCILIAFLALPALLMSALPGHRLRDCNLSWEGFKKHYRIYIGLYALVFPVIYIFSWSPSFYTFYPMYSAAGRSWFDLLAWEGMYAGQFIALEFFFRGFLVGGLSRYIGILAVPVSVMPYMMIHFAKPLPEVAASVVAGFILGFLAWRTKSIWGGVFIHCAVAASMDLMALSQKGQLPWLGR